ncbi:MAG: hypothetical protein ACRCUS_01330, partial [Anaerovoracaceae bacterium]
ENAKTYTEDLEIVCDLEQNSNYSISTVSADFIITKRPITVTTDLAQKEYDGKPLFNKAATVTEGTLAWSETVETLNLSYTGTQTEIGSSENTATADNDNYDITVQYGTLTVTPVNKPPVVKDPDTKKPPVKDPDPKDPKKPGTSSGTMTAKEKSMQTADKSSDGAAKNSVLADTDSDSGTSGSWALINLLLAALTVLISLALAVTFFLRKKRDSEEQMHEEENGEEKTEVKRKLIWRLASIVVAIIAVVAFILTEDMSQSMILTDKWTLFMAVIGAAQFVIAFLSRKEEKEEVETDTI